MHRPLAPWELPNQQRPTEGRAACTQPPCCAQNLEMQKTSITNGLGGHVWRPAPGRGVQRAEKEMAVLAGAPGSGVQEEGRGRAPHLGPGRERGGGLCPLRGLRAEGEERHLEMWETGRENKLEEVRMQGTA